MGHGPVSCNERSRARVGDLGVRITAAAAAAAASFRPQIPRNCNGESEGLSGSCSCVYGVPSNRPRRRCQQRGAAADSFAALRHPSQLRLFSASRRSKTIVEASPARKPRASAALLLQAPGSEAPARRKQEGGSPTLRRLHHFANDSAGLPSCCFCPANNFHLGRRQGAAVRSAGLQWSRQLVAPTWRR